MTIKERMLSFLCNIHPKRSQKTIKDAELEAEKEIEKITDEKYIEEQARLEKERQESKSLHLFSFDNTVRVTLNAILNHRNFEWLMIILILINSIGLALDNPLNDPESDFSFNL